MKSCTSARRARGRQRGAAMLEAVIVALFLVGVFLGLVFIAGLYETKLRAGHAARARNMQNATNACKPEGSSLDWPLQAPADGQSQGLEDEIRSLVDVQRYVVEGGGLSHVEVRSDFSFGRADPKHAEQKPPLSSSVSWRSTTACNPAVVGMNPLELLDKLGIKDEIASVMSEGF